MHNVSSHDITFYNFYCFIFSSDAKLTRILRSLHSLNGNSQQHMVTRNNITSKFPWIRQNNTLPNYFLGGGTRSSDLYKSSPAIFLHQHRSAGEPLVRCLRDIAEEGHLSHVPNWDSDTREFWDVKLCSKSEYQRLNLQTGQFAAGLCDIYKDRQCSYFSVFREPMSRAVSSYHHCQTDEGRRLDEMCRVVDANDVTLRDWILVQGSVTFQQLVFHAPWCQQFKQTNNYSLEGSAVHVTPSSEWPCWFKNRIYLERLPATEYSHLLEYVLDHMESLFGAIGILDDWESTIGIFETVYKLPFRKCSNLMQLPADVYNDHDNRANRKPQKDGYYDDNDPDYLKYDYFVRKVLDADFKIYKKARQIFDIQRQTAFNKLKR